MKKLLIVCLACLATLNLFAQTNKIAVINFKANVGITQNDVDGIFAIFTTYFSPLGWTLVERNQIDRVISEQGFQKSSMTEAQMVKVGKIMNLKKIVIGDVNVISGKYNLDVRVVDVETGDISAKDGAEWTGTSYRSFIQTLAQRLSSGIAIQPKASLTAATTPKPIVAPTSESKDIITLYGYLIIHPQNLGTFTSEPITVISNLNKNGECGYDSWRIPTQEEWELISSNAAQVSGISKDIPYMTSSNRSDGREKVVRLVTTDTKTIIEKEQEKQEAARQAELRRQENERKLELAKQEAERKRKEREAEIARENEIARQNASLKVFSTMIQGPFTNARALYEYRVPEGYHIASKEEIAELIQAYQILGKSLSFPVYTDISTSYRTDTQYFTVRVSNKKNNKFIRSDDRSRTYKRYFMASTCIKNINDSATIEGYFIDDTSYYDFYKKYNTVGEHWRHETYGLRNESVNTSITSGYIYLVINK